MEDRRYTSDRRKAKHVFNSAISEYTFYAFLLFVALCILLCFVTITFIIIKAIGLIISFY
jgi:hypothetical protein